MPALQRLLFMIFMRFPVLLGLFLMGLGLSLVIADLDTIKEFHTFAKAKEIRGVIVSVKPGDTSQPRTDITISWFDAGSRREGVISTDEEAEIGVQREGRGMLVEAAKLQEGDSAKILVSAKGHSVMFAPAKPREAPPLVKFLGVELTPVGLFGLALTLGGIAFLVFRKRFVLGQN